MKPHRASLHYVERTILGLDTPIAKGTYSEPQREGGVPSDTTAHGQASDLHLPPLRSPLALVGVVLQFFWPSFMSQPQLIDGSCNTYSILFDSCLGEERSLFEFEVVTLREPPGRDPSLLFDFHPYIWYVESLVKSTLLDRVCFNFTLDSCRVARLTSGRVNL